MAKQKNVAYVVVTGWPLLPPAIRHLHNCGLEIIATSPDPDVDELIGKIEQYQPKAIIVRSEEINKRCFDAATELQAVAYHGVGYDVIDVATATRRGIPVFIAPGRNAISVAEHAIGLILAIRKQFLNHDGLIRNGKWRPAKPATSEIHGSTIGLVGLGAIGNRLTELSQAFGMKTIAYDPGSFKSWPAHITRCDLLDDLLVEADIVSLHIPLTPLTKGMIGADAIAKMKSGAILINTARGGIVDEQALVAAMKSGHLYGAGLDVFEQEPPGAGAELYTCDNVILTPHIAGVTPESALRMSMCCAENISRFLLHGEAAADDVVNPEWKK
ncbi:MAG: hypothetical protein GKR97_18020 [Rhizobiaceae bacterium]|nr:hypothetical protein [Rhizobiaceae bacterium]